MKIDFPITPWEPDRSAYNPGVSQVMKNVTIREDHLAPFPSLVPFSAALPTAPRGAIIGWSSAGTATIFAGTATKLFKLNTSTLAWDDVTRTTGGNYALGTEDVWQFTQFGSRLTATTQSEDPQYFDLDSSSNFAALGGNPGAQLACATIGDHVMFGNNGELKWSGLNSPEVYTPRRRGADFQALPDGGNILSIVPLTQLGGLVFQENAIREVIPTFDNRTVFRIVKTNEERGAIAPRAVVSTGDQVFFMANDGLFEYGAPSGPIGFEKVDRFVLDSIDPNRLYLTEAVRDPVNQVVYWRYKTQSSPSDETTDRILAYNYRLGRYSLMEIELTGMLPATTPGYTLEGLDSFAGGLEDLPFPLDSSAWAASTPVIGAFDADYKLGLFQGSPLEAVIETGYAELNPGRRTFVSGWRPLVDTPLAGAQVHGRVGSKSIPGDPTTWGADSARISATGIVPARREGRLHVIEMTIPAGTSWTSAHGIALDPEHKVTTGRR